MKILEERTLGNSAGSGEEVSLSIRENWRKGVADCIGTQGTKAKHPLIRRIQKEAVMMKKFG